MDVKLYPYQRFWINLISRSTEFIGYCVSRQCKKLAYRCICNCALHSLSGYNRGFGFFLPKAQAGLIISEKCVSLHNEHPNICKRNRKHCHQPEQMEMTFVNGSKIKRGGIG